MGYPCLSLPVLSCMYWMMFFFLLFRSALFTSDHQDFLLSLYSSTHLHIRKYHSQYTFSFARRMKAMSTSSYTFAAFRVYDDDFTVSVFHVIFLGNTSFFHDFLFCCSVQNCISSIPKKRLLSGTNPRDFELLWGCFFYEWFSSLTRERTTGNSRENKDEPHVWSTLTEAFDHFTPCLVLSLTLCSVLFCRLE